MVCAETGIPSLVSAPAISVTECPARRSSSARARSWPVALRGPLGPGVDAGGGVAEPVGDLGGGHLVHEVGAQRLVPALPRAGGRREVLRAFSHRLPQRVSLKYLPSW